MSTATRPAEELTNGWEPTSPIGDTLLRRYVFAHAGKLQAMAEGAGRRSTVTAAAHFADPGSPFAFDNAVTLVRPPDQVDLEALVEEAKAFFPPGSHWVLHSVWPTPDLSGLGLHLVGHPPLMFRPPSPLPASPPELTIVEVDDAAGMAAFEATLADGYPIAGPGPRSVVGPRVVGSAVRLFVGYVGGKPVSVAGAAVGHGLVDVDWVATLPADRGRSYGSALTAAAVDIAPDLPAVLIASDPGRPIYQRLGFIDLLRTTMWEAKP